MTHLLDTSAWLAHVFKEPGWDYINDLFADDEAHIGLSVLSLAEMHGRLRALKCDERFESVRELYRPLFSQIVAVDERVALRAIELKRAATDRLPSFDALIAGTASLNNAVLIHRDKHFQCLPADQLQHRMLPRLPRAI